MRRRQFLSVSAAAAATSTGCLDRLRSPPEELRFTVEGEGVSDDRQLHHSVEPVNDDLVSPEEPPSVEVSLANESGSTWSYGERRHALLWTASAGDFWLLPLDEADLERSPDHGFWRLSEEGFAMTEEYQFGELEPGEVDSQELAVVWRGSDADEPAPSTSLRFEAEFYVFEGAEPIPDDGDRYSWGFVLHPETGSPEGY